MKFHDAEGERDAESGNDYFGARYYGSNVAGRFMSPDPSGLYFANPNYPQSLNLYAYVQNNPLTLTDPTGMDCIYSSGSFQPGRCVSDPNNGVYYVDGTITNSTFNPQTGDFGYTFTNYADGSGSSGTGVINFSPPPSLGSQTINLSDLVPYISLSQGLQQGAGTPNNGTSWYQNTCIQSALAKGAGSTALDAVGLLPEGGAVSAAFSLWHGAAGVSNGTKILQGVKAGAGIVSTASAGSNSNWFGGVTGAFSIGASLAKAAPVYGQVLSGISMAGDVYGTYKAVANCQ